MKSLFACVALFIACCLKAQLPLPEKPGMHPFPGDTTWTKKISMSNEEWKKVLTHKQYEITRDNGTEPAFSKGNLSDNHEKGMYYCASCGNPLFSSSTKFDSGTGWPSFWRAYSTKSVSTHPDHSGSMERTAVSCQRCDAHLGHVFDDGPKPTGLRYCMNGWALQFRKQ